MLQNIATAFHGLTQGHHFTLAGLALLGQAAYTAFGPVPDWFQAAGYATAALAAFGFQPRVGMAPPAPAPAPAPAAAVQQPGAAGPPAAV